jgi:hypothetical protein
MSTFMVIPSYWARKSKSGWQQGDAIYDHPTPLDQDGTLGRMLKSLHSLDDHDFSLVVLACATAQEIEEEVQEKVASLVREADPPVPTHVISHSHLRALHQVLVAAGRDELVEVLSLTGYSNIRNMCLMVPYILGAEMVILIDDDEFIDDVQFISKAREFIGSRFMGQTIDGVAGYYINSRGTYYDDVPEEIHWMTYWDRFGSKREAFDKIIPGEPRLKLTPFAFGGCMVIHRSLFRTVPFDPRITRGEDTDYVLNARMFGFNFFMDNQLFIQHRPPPKKHPTWRRFREDIFRLLYSKAKLDGQTPQTNMSMLTAEDFDPYPGEFMKDTLEDKILKTNLILALDYLANDQVQDAKETIRNIWLAKTKAMPKTNPFDHYLIFQRKWRSLRKLVRRELHDQVSLVLQRGELYYEEEQERERAKIEEFEKAGEKIDLLGFDTAPFFEGFDRRAIERLQSISQRELFLKDEVILEEGSADEEMILVELGAGEMLGEVSLVIEAPHAATVTALETTEVITFDRQALFQLMEENPDIAARIWSRLAQALGNKLKNSNDRYLSHAREVHDDVADKLLETGPLMSENDLPPEE